MTKQAEQEHRVARTEPTGITGELKRTETRMPGVFTEPSVIIEDPDLVPPVRRSTDPARRFFHLDDEGNVSWWIVATDVEHAKRILREMGAEFGQDGVFLDEAERQGLVEWEEMDAERVARVLRCHRDEDGDTRPLADCEMGDSFCSEW